MKLNKIVFATASVLAITAGTTTAQAGAYVGVKGGFSHMNTKAATKNAAGTTTSKQAKIKGNGFAADLFAGYKTDVNGVMVAGEASVGLDTASNKKELKTLKGVNTGTKARISRKQNVALSALVGYEVMPKVTPFVKLGLGASKVKAQLSGATNTKKSKYALNYVPGVGVDYAVTDKVSARAEVEVAINTGKKFKGTPVSLKTKKAYTTAVKVGAVYNV